MSSSSLKVVFDDNIDMVTNSIGAIFNLNNNFDKVRGRSLDASAYKPKSPSVLSSKSKEVYYTRIQQESDRMDEDEPDSSPGSVKLKYKIQSQNHQVSKATDSSFNTRQQCTLTTDPTLNIPHCESMFNIQLNYDPDTALNPDSWDENFHAVLLYGFMEHLAFDALNIKESLTRMWKFIAGKSINGNKANDLKDLNGMGKAIWKFISIVYDSHWDFLYVNDNNTTFRSKVKSKFSPQVKNIQPPVNKGKEVAKPSFVSVILLLIPAKLNKEVKEISKFFKKNWKTSHK